MRDKYTYADVIIDPDDPRVEIGKEYYSAIASKDVLDFANHNEELAKLIEVDPGIKYPFHIKSDCCDCWTCLLIRKKEPEKKYVPFDLTKEEDRARLRGAWIRSKDEWKIETLICEFYESCASEMVCRANDHTLTANDLFIDWTFLDGSPCGRLVEEK